MRAMTLDTSVPRRGHTPGEPDTLRVAHPRLRHAGSHAEFVSLSLAEDSAAATDSCSKDRPDTASGRPRNGSTCTTLRVLTHELRTPINHIIGYSEMLLEDLAAGSNATSRRVIAVVHATGKELLTLVNTELGSAGAPDETVLPEVIAAVRSAVQRSLDRIPVDDLAGIAQAHPGEFAGDVVKILNATARLAEFARAGTIRTSE